MPEEVEHILQFFACDFDMPEPQFSIYEGFAELAYSVVVGLPRNPERTVALRKLLEARDAAVRASVAK